MEEECTDRDRGAHCKYLPSKMSTTSSFVVQTQGHFNLKAICHDGIGISISTVDGVTVFEINEPDTTVEVVVRRKNSDAVDCSTDVDGSEPITVFTSEQAEEDGEESGVEDGDNFNYDVDSNNDDAEEIEVSPFH